MPAPGEREGLRAPLLRWTNLAQAAGQPRGSSGARFPYTHRAERAPSLGSFPEGPGSPAGAHRHGQGVPELHEEEDPAPGPAVAAGGAAPRAEAGGAAEGPETRTGGSRGTHGGDEPLGTRGVRTAGMGASWEENSFMEAHGSAASVCCPWT